MTATLVIAPNRGDGLTAGTVVSAAVRAGVRPEEGFESNIAEILEDFEPDSKEFEAVIARGKPARPGEDATVRWEPGLVSGDGGDDDGGAEPVDGDDGDEGDEGDDGGVDHYAVATFTTVEEGQVVGIITEKTKSTPGYDVCGEELTARDGHPFSLKLCDKSFEVTGSGTVTALRGGRVTVKSNAAVIDPVFIVDSDVDFSVGHVDFMGAIEIRGGVRDRFSVKCTGDGLITGLIESATILIGGSLICESGMAAKERGQLMVDQECSIGYINQARGVVGGNLTLRRELIESELVVGGALRLEAGAIVGGSYIVTGAVEADIFGSGAGAPTRFVLGEVPLIANAIRRLDQLLIELDGEIAAASMELEELKAKPLPNPDLENEIAAQQVRREERKGMMFERRDVLMRSANESRTVDLHARRKICHRVSIVHGNRSYVFEDDVEGASKVFLDGAGDPVISIKGREPRLLGDLCRIEAASFRDGDSAEAA